MAARSGPEAVLTGEGMAGRGRAADTVPAYQALPPTEQQGVRIGYANRVLDPLERTDNPPTILRAKSPKGVAELEAMSQYQGPRQPGAPDPLRQFLTREEEMQRTGIHALGGPATAENLADIGARPGGAEALGLIQSAANGTRYRSCAACSTRRGDSRAARMRHSVWRSRAHCWRAIPRTSLG